MWVCFDSELNKDYSRKFRQLQASLRHDENQELRYRILQGLVEPLSVAKLQPHQLASKARQAQMEDQMKQYFDSKVKIDESEDGASGSRVIKTDAGLEFVSVVRKETEALEEKKSPAKEATPSKTDAGNDVAEK